MTRGDISTALESIKNLATTGAIVAIASADRGADYYLLEVTGWARDFVIRGERRLGAIYLPGAEIIRGWFLNKSGNSLYDYELIVGEKAVIYAGAIRYICPELNVSCIVDKQQIYHLSEQLHLDILESLHGF